MLPRVILSKEEGTLFRDRRQHALILYDDLTKQAWACRHYPCFVLTQGYNSPEFLAD